jgi:hypothetical protein
MGSLSTPVGLEGWVTGWMWGSQVEGKENECPYGQVVDCWEPVVTVLLNHPTENPSRHFYSNLEFSPNTCLCGTPSPYDAEDIRIQTRIVLSGWGYGQPWCCKKLSIQLERAFALVATLPGTYPCWSGGFADLPECFVAACQSLSLCPYLWLCIGICSLSVDWGDCDWWGQTIERWYHFSMSAAYMALLIAIVMTQCCWPTYIWTLRA